MGRRDVLIAKYAKDIEDSLAQTPDIDLLTKVTIGCGPSIYVPDGETVAASDEAEVARIRDGYLKQRLGLPEGVELDTGLQQVLDDYGSANQNRYRAVVYYMLCRHFGRESAYI